MSEQATCSKMILGPMTNYGWSFHDNTFSTMWNSHDNIAAVRERINVLLKGCKCATGCSTKRCGCRKNGKDCSVGCGCRNCDNYAQEEETKDTENELATIAIDEDLGNEKRRDLDDIMDWIFGGEVGDSNKDSEVSCDEVGEEEPEKESDDTWD